MSYTSQYNGELGIIEVVLTGKVFLDEVKVLFRQTIQQIIQHHCFNLLYDFALADVKYTKLDIKDLQRSFDDQIDIIGEKKLEITRAIIYPELSYDADLEELISFYPCSKVKLCSTRSEARVWLFSR
jgi:hypothetical protein